MIVTITMSAEDKCRNRLWNLLRHLETAHQSYDRLQHFFRELHETERCDHYMPELKPVREELLDKIKRDAAPDIMQRIASRKVTEDDKDAMLKNYMKWEHWLTKCVRTTLYTHDLATYVSA